MNIGQKLILILRQELTGGKEKITVAAEELPALFRLSDSLSVAHIVSQYLYEQGLLGEDEISAAFKKRQMNAFLVLNTMEKDAAAAFACLEKHRIAYIPLKGAVLRTLYPEPYLRNSCDVDVLVKEEDLQRAADALCEELGFRAEKRFTHDMVTVSPHGIHLELHFALIEHDAAAEEALGQVWEKAVPEQGCRFTMAQDDFALYHFAHIAKHFVHGGCGVRPVMDTWLLLHRTELLREENLALLQECGLLTFARHMMQLAEVWFTGAQPDEVSLEMQEYLLSGGTYGRVENRTAILEAKRGNRFTYLLHRAFAPRRLLEKRFPRLKAHPWLLPYYQVKRWVMTDGFRRGKREIEIGSRVSQERKDTLKKLLEDTGLTESEMI